MREICDRHGILLCADEVICGFGRLGAWFGSERYDIQPDLITSAKGLSSAYASIGALIAADHVMQPFLEQGAMYSHGVTFGGHPVQCAVALKNIEIMKRDRIVEHVADRRRTSSGRPWRRCCELPIVGDLRGTGFFYALELVKDKETRETFTEEECDRLLRGFLSPRLYEKGLICRADDRGDPVIQLSPPLVAGQAEFDEIARILGEVLTEASAARVGPDAGAVASTATAPHSPTSTGLSSSRSSPASSSVSPTCAASWARRPGRRAGGRGRR